MRREKGKCKVMKGSRLRKYRATPWMQKERKQDGQGSSVSVGEVEAQVGSRRGAVAVAVLAGKERKSR